MRVLALEGRSSGFWFTSWAPFGGGGGTSGSEGFGAAGVDLEGLASEAGGEAVSAGWGGSGRAGSIRNEFLESLGLDAGKFGRGVAYRSLLVQGRSKLLPGVRWNWSRKELRLWV